MKKLLFASLFTALVLLACEPLENTAIAPVDEEAAPEAVSLLGKELFSAEPSAELMERYNAARTEYLQNPDDADAIIWYGRRTAYLGSYNEAIVIFSEGALKFPEDARFLRHRGHRYLSIRQFEKAIKDFDKASLLIMGTEDIVEPDGMPNALNIPLSSLHDNIYYHLGLAYYLTEEYITAAKVYETATRVNRNNDMLVSRAHWHWMTLMRQGDAEQAAAVVADIGADWEIIENMAYHRLCLVYKGELTIEEITSDDLAGSAGDAFWYGVGNWYLVNGEQEKAKEVFEQILAGPGWASFGYIAAEADYARLFVK
jgi:tetratricopeptide (TPR) repeat protein